jgi:hypothetical protein
MTNALTTQQLETLTWKISRIIRCIDLAFIFKSNWEAHSCINDAVASLKEANAWINSAALSSAEGQAVKIAEAHKCLGWADGFITEALSVIPHHQDQGAVSNLVAGRKAIWEEAKVINSLMA